MNYLYNIFCFLLIVSTNVYSKNLQDVLDEVLKSHPELSSFQSRYEESVVKVGQAKSGYLPSIDFSAEYSEKKSSNTTTRSASTDDQFFNTNSLSIIVQQNLFNGLKTKYGVLEAEHDALVDLQQLSNKREKLILSTSEAFINVLKQEQLLNLAKSNIELHQKTYDQIVLMYKQGLSNESDVAQITGRLSQAKSFVVNSEQSYSEALNQYKSIVGRVDTNLNDINDIEIPFKTMQASLDALSRKPVLLAAKQEIQSAKARYKLEKGDFYPRVDFEIAQSSIKNANGIDNKDDDLSASIKFKYNLFRGNADRLEVKQASKRVSASEYSYDNLFREHKLKLQNSWAEFEGLENKKEYLISYEKSTDKTFNLYKKQFNLDQRTLLDVLNSANELFQARVSLVNLYFDLLTAKLNIIYNSGFSLQKIKFN